MKTSANKRVYTCPVCGYDEMNYPPESGNICACCGTEFENDDYDFTHKELRKRWICNGLHWFSKAVAPPKNWNPYRQLITASELYALDLIASSRMDTDIDYRYAVDEALSDSRMARQLKIEREGQPVPLTQVQLAHRAEMKQSRISELERTDYSAWSVSTLRRLARALGVRFVFGFESWNQLVPETIGAFAEETLWVVQFEQDTAFRKLRLHQIEGGADVALPFRMRTLLGNERPAQQPSTVPLDRVATVERVSKAAAGAASTSLGAQ